MKAMLETRYRRYYNTLGAAVITNIISDDQIAGKLCPYVLNDGTVKKFPMTKVKYVGDLEPVNNLVIINIPDGKKYKENAKERPFTTEFFGQYLGESQAQGREKRNLQNRRLERSIEPKLSEYFYKGSHTKRHSNKKAKD